MPSLPPLASLLLEPIHFLISLVPYLNLLFLFPRYDHFAPHPYAPFEGYYTRLVTPSGATILLIFSSVFSAKSKPHLLHFSYLPRDSRSPAKIIVDKFPHINDATERKKLHDNGVQEFTRIAKGDGAEGIYAVGRYEQRYQLRLETKEYGLVEVEVETGNRTPWKRGDELSTPEGVFSWLVYLMPLHWNVLSTHSTARFSIKRDGETVEAGDDGVAHVEKNWGVSFPDGWTWLQGFYNGGERTFCMAGGKTMGQKAYLLGYRSGKVEVSFKPLWSVMPFGIPMPWARDWVDSDKGRIGFDVCDLTKKLVVEARAPGPEDESWVGLKCPLKEGHGNVWAWETFVGRIRVKVMERGWGTMWRWKLVEETEFEDAAVEFGGEYRASKSKQ